jgi:hypothetical protein
MQRESNTPSLKEEKRRPSPSAPASTPLPFTQTFLSPQVAGARAAYLKILVGGTFLIILAVFAIFSIYWGSLWKTPVRNLEGWVVVCFHLWLWAGLDDRLLIFGLHLPPLCLFILLFLRCVTQDFDNGLIGETITNALTTPSPFSKVTWNVVSASQFPGGPAQLANAVIEQKVWAAVAGAFNFSFLGFTSVLI